MPTEVPREPKPELAAAAIRAVKAAYLNLNADAVAPSGGTLGPGPWVGVGMSQAYTSPDAVARCAHAPRGPHEAPAWGCTCGFYAIGGLEELKLYRCDDGHTWELEVALWGRVIEHDSGYRAERQRVLLARPPRFCEVCGAPNTPAKYLTNRPGQVVRGECERHLVQGGRAEVILAGELEAIIGAPIDCPASMRDGPPPPDLGALLERLTLAVERGGLRAGAGTGAGYRGPAFPKEWEPLLADLMPGYRLVQQIPTRNPAAPLTLEVALEGHDLLLRFRDPCGYAHDVRLPLKSA